MMHFLWYCFFFNLAAPSVPTHLTKKKKIIKNRNKNATREGGAIVQLWCLLLCLFAYKFECYLCSNLFSVQKGVLAWMKFGSCLASHRAFAWLNLRNVLLMCQSSKSLSLVLHRRRANSFAVMPHLLLCSSNSGSSKQLCLGWSGAKIVVYSISFTASAIFSGVLNFLERCSKRCPFPSVRRLLGELGGSKTSIEIWCLVLLVGSYRNPLCSCPQAHCGTTYMRKPYWESSANIQDHCQLSSSSLLSFSKKMGEQTCPLACSQFSTSQAITLEAENIGLVNRILKCIANFLE